MKVCMFVSNAPPLFSGASKQALLVSQTIKSISDVKIEILSIDKDKIKNNDLLIKRIFKSNGIFIYSIRVFTYFFKNKFDIIHFHGIYYWHIVIILYLFYRRKMIFKITMKGQDDLETISQLALGKIRIAILKKVKALIALTDEFINDDFNNIYVIPNGVDINEYFPISLGEKKIIKSKLGLEKNVPSIIYSGVICERKNQLDLLKKLEPLLCKNKILLILCGSYENDFGEYDESYVTSVFNYANQFSNIHITGHVNNVREYYQVSDFIISNSTNEGLSNSLLEGVFCGLIPIIMNYKAQYIPNIIKKIGLTIEPTLPNQLICKKIEKLIFNNHSKFDLNDIYNEYSIENVTNQLLNIYKM